MNEMYIIFKLMSVVFLIESATGFRDVDLNDLTLKTVVSLLKILGKYENDVKYVIVQPNQWTSNKHTDIIGKTYHSRFNKGIKKNYSWKPKGQYGDSIGKAYHRPRFYNNIINNYAVQDKKFHKPGKHMLVKRLLPHGLPPAHLEYDSRYNTFYRPLVRVHKRKAVPKIGTILNIDGTTNGMDNYGIDMYDYYDNDENVLKFAKNTALNENLHVDENLDADEELLQPFKKQFTEYTDPPEEVSAELIILEDIQKLLRKIRSRSSRMKIYDDITKVLDKIESLRSNQKSGEDNDPMAPGKLVNLEDDVEKGPPNPKNWIPHYAPWNFWTYKKIIYQDVCPKGQVKIANLCIWVPPH